MAQTTTAAAVSPAAAPAGETRRRRRRTPEAVLRAVYPVSAILAAATEEERKAARGLVSELLGYWLGHESKAELSRRLGIPPIRVWQMSQRAMAGMVAALLRPPMGRRGAMPRLDPEVKTLRKRVLELQAETDLQRRLIELLRTMPRSSPRELPKEQQDAAKHGRRRSKASRAKSPGRSADPGPGVPPEPPAATR